MKKKSLRETVADSQRGLDTWAAAFGKTQTVSLANKPKREIVNRSDPNELEASVISEVGKLLAVHPNVLFACRSNSGAAYMTGRNGKDMPVTFNKIIRSPETVCLPDFWGLLRDGRFLAIECKRRNWTKPTDQHEREQAAFLQMIRDIGGVGIFATCAENVLDSIK